MIIMFMYTFLFDIAVLLYYFVYFENHKSWAFDNRILNTLNVNIQKVATFRTKLEFNSLNCSFKS